MGGTAVAVGSSVKVAVRASRVIVGVFVGVGRTGVNVGGSGVSVIPSVAEGGTGVEVGSAVNVVVIVSDGGSDVSVG